MKTMLSVAGIATIATFLIGCGQNEPGTMGGEPATPRTVATGAPAEAAKDSSVSNPEASALKSEHAMSSFDDSAATNTPSEPRLPQASTISTNSNAPR